MNLWTHSTLSNWQTLLNGPTIIITFSLKMHLITKKHHHNPSDNPSNHTPQGSPTAATSAQRKISSTYLGKSIQQIGNISHKD